jgi:hypothetical protein
MLDVGLMVLGCVWVGLAISVLLAGFGLVDVVPEVTSAGPLLLSALILGVAGLFCLGLASEGPLGRGRRLVGFKLWEVGVGRILAVFGVGLLGLFLYGLLDRVTEGLPLPLLKGVVALRAVSVAGMTAMPLIGVPLSLLLHWAPINPDWVRRADLPAMFVVWVLATLVVL